MKKRYIISGLAVLMICLFIVMASDTRGGRAPGGGGHPSGGGGHIQSAPHPSGGGAPHFQMPRQVSRPSQTFHYNQNLSRTPSMSPSLRQRPTAPAPTRNVQRLPSQPTFRQPISRPQTRPTAEQLKQFVHGRQGGKPSPTFNASRQTNRQAASQFLQQSRPAGTKRGSIPLPPDFASRFRQQNNINIQAAGRVQAQVSDRHPQHNNWFNDRFFEDHHNQRFFNNSGVDWWGSPGWAGCADWLPWGWQYPNYYYPDYYPDYNNTGYPPASDLYLQLQSQALGTSEQPSEQGYYPQYNQGPEIGNYPQYAPPPETEVPYGPPPGQGTSYQGTAPAVQEEWLPLGVFAAGKTADEAGYSNMFVQLALDKAGDIAGTYYNAATDETHNLDGLVDKDTQEAVWKVTDNPQSPVMTTGLYNLTQDVATVEVHFQDGTVQPWVLVRLKK